MENGVARPEDRLADERVRIVENVEVEGVNVEGDENDGVEERHVLKNEIGRRAEVLPLQNDDGDQTGEDAEDCQRENDSIVNARIFTAEVGEEALGDVPKHLVDGRSASGEKKH